MKQIIAAALLLSTPALARTVEPGILQVANVSQSDAIARLAADCTANGKEIAGQNESNISCNRPPTAETVILCKALFYSGSCPDTARDVWHFAVLPTAAGVEIRYLWTVYREAGKERPFIGAGKNGFEPQLRALFPEAL